MERFASLNVALVAALFIPAWGCSGEDVAPIRCKPTCETFGGANAGESGVGGAGGTGSSKGGSAQGGGAQTGGAQSGGSSAQGGSSSTGGGKASGGTGMVACNEPASAAPPETWVNATGNLAGMQSECGNLGLVSAQPCSKRVIAGVAQQGLWQTLDGGQTWTKLGTGPGSAQIKNRISAIVYDPLDPQTFWESGIYNGGGVYKTTDSGTTFEQLGDVTHCDSVSVDLTDPERKTLLAGTHENNTPLHASLDGGQTWNNIASGLPDGFCTSTLVLSSTVFLVGCTGSIARTTSAGRNWDIAAGSTGGIFQPLLASDGTIYWPGNGGGISKSTDNGMSFSSVATPDVAPGIIAPTQLAELPDGRIVINGKDHLLASSDGGATWVPIGAPLPYAGGGYDGTHGLAYSAQTKTFFVWRWDCSNNVPNNAIMSMGYDWEAR